MDNLNNLLGNCNLNSQSEIIKANPQIKILIQSYETIKWLRIALEQNKVGSDLCNTFMLQTKLRLITYLPFINDETTDVIKQLINIYTKNIDNVIANTAPKHITLPFLLEIAYETHKMLLNISNIST